MSGGPGPGENQSGNDNLYSITSPSRAVKLLYLLRLGCTMTSNNFEATSF